MTGKRFILKENDLIDDTQLNILLDGGEDKEDMVDLLNELHEENEQLRHDATILIQSNQDYRKENEQLRKENNKLHQKIFEMRTNIALERTEISKQTYTGKKNEKEYLTAKEFLDEIEKW